jgi:NADH-quinone oxidoreductase subunit M
MFAQVFNFAPVSNKITYLDVFTTLSQQIIIYTVIAMFTILVTLTLLHISVTKWNKFNSLYVFFKILTSVALSIIFTFVFIKFMIYLWNLHSYASFLDSDSIAIVKLHLISESLVFTINSSLLGDVIILLAFSSGIVCLHLLGEKNVAVHLPNIGVFSSFLIATILMVYTVNLLVMFISFEFLFIPTLYFVYKHGYVERTDKTMRILLYWTLCGAFLVLASLAYLFFKYKSLDYLFLRGVTFTQLEGTILYFAIFLGFGVKVPVFPFHYWLTKIHVEAPAGFSIFLSGFLVKAAIYCFFYFHLIFQNELSIRVATTVAFLGVLESSVKLWTQTDFKKLIAFATIQEMNLILFLLIGYQNTFDYGLILFILIHGWLSTLMFFLVDIIQKKTSTRNIVNLSGLAIKFTSIRFIIWAVIILFGGFPLTVKFAIEWQVLGILVLQSKHFLVFFFFVMITLGVLGFIKQMFIILYGFPREESNVSDTIVKKDRYLFYFILSILLFLNILNFMLS